MNDWMDKISKPNKEKKKKRKNGENNTQIEMGKISAET